MSAEEPKESRRLRIVRIIARLNVGGPARHVAWLTAGMNDERFQSLLVTGTIPSGEQDLEGFARAMEVEPMIIGEMSRTISWKDILVVWKLLRLFFRIRPDIVHTHTAKAGTVGRVAGVLYRLISRRRVRFVHTFHGHVFHGYYGRAATAVFLWIERILARFTNAIIVLSPRQRDEIHSRYGVGRSGQFRIVPLGLDMTASDRPGDGSGFRRELNIQPDAFVAAMVGRLTEVKDHAFFLASVSSWTIADPAHSAIVDFLIIGDGHLRPALEQTTRDLGLNGRVRFLGNRSDPEVFYQALDLLVLTSRNEGTPLTILEAMANGVPVLATAVGGVPDLLGKAITADRGVTVCERGVLIEHGDSVALGRALSILVADPLMRRDITARAREHVRQQYSRERLLRDMRALYEELCAQ